MSIHDRFPNGMTLKKKETTQISVAGEQFEFQTLITERFSDELNERVAVFVARRLSNNEIAILKLRVQMNPLLIEPVEDRNEVVKWATEVFREECQAIEACQEATPYSPRFYGCAELRQDNTYEFPGGYLHAVAMSRVPGCPVPDIIDLTDDERSLIRAQLVETLEIIRQQGWTYLEGDPEQMFFDRTTRQTYLIGFDRADKIEDRALCKPVTEDSYVIWEFGLYVWRELA